MGNPWASTENSIFTSRGGSCSGCRRAASASARSRRCSAATCWPPPDAGARCRRPAGSSGCRTSRRRPSASSSSTSPAGRRSSRRSTTSRGSRKFQGTQIPDSVRQGQRVAQTMGQSSLPVAQSMFEFAQHGKSGTWVSELLPHTAKIVDDITVIKTMNTDAINHDPAITFIQTGFQQPGRPSMGAWLSYGLGSENQNLPAFVVLLSQAHAINTDQPLFSRLWASGFLPSSYQGVRFRARQRAGALSRRSSGRRRKTTRRQMLDAVAKLNAMKHEAYGDPEIETRIAQYEMAYRMQTSVPDLMDLSKEPDSVFEMYGPGLAQAGHVCRQLPARAPARRAQRALHPALSSRLGSAQRSAARSRAAVQRHRPADRRAHHRSQAARAARRHAGRLGRRVRPHGLQPGQADRRQLRARSSSAQLLHVGGRRRHEARTSCSARPTTSATTSCPIPVSVYDLQATILHLLGIDHNEADVPIPGPRLPADRRPRRGGGEDSRVSCNRLRVIGISKTEHRGPTPTRYQRRRLATNLVAFFSFLAKANQIAAPGCLVFLTHRRRAKRGAGSAWGWGPTRGRGGGAPRNKLSNADIRPVAIPAILPSASRRSTSSSDSSIHRSMSTHTAGALSDWLCPAPGHEQQAARAGKGLEDAL